MKKEFLQNILKKLCFQIGVSAYEKECGISDFLFNLVKKVNSNTKFDSFGNIVSVIGNGKKVLILEAHMDEVGFIVRNYKNNIINIYPQGIINGEKVKNKSVFIVGKNIEGNIIVNKEKFIFNPKKKEKAKEIEKNDIVAFTRSFFEKENGIIEASALDNRIGCTVLISVMKKIIRNVPKGITLIFIFSTKEEINGSCFKDIIKKYGGDFSIICDAAYAQPVDFDITKESGVLIPILGNGCAIQLKGKGFNVNKKIIRKIESIAKSNKIKFQEESAPKGLGKTNLVKMLKQKVKSGAVINIPAKNQHNQFATTNIFDANSAVFLIYSLIKQYNNFTI